MNFFQYLANKYAPVPVMDADDSEVPVEKCRCKDGPGACSVHGPMMKAELSETDDLSYDTEKLDAEYMDAVNRGDTEKCAKMVREAAARAMPNTKVVDNDGKPKVVYHGTRNAPFTSFDKDRIGDTDKDVLGKHTEFGDGFYFTPSESYANMFAGRFEWLKDTMCNGTVLSCFVNIKDPLQYEASRMQIKNNYSEKEIYSHDGVLAYRDPKPGTDYFDKANLIEIVVFSSDNIKSADPVTYDDDGNPIPLSKRFQMDNPDIRY